MPFQTKQKAGTAAAAPAAARRWGDPGVSERFKVLESTVPVIPNAPQIPLSQAGILSELQHHIFATNLTVTHGTGTNAKDAYGPYPLLQQYRFVAGANTPLVSISGRMLGMLQMIEYPGRSWEADADPVSVENPLTNTSDFFNHPATTGTFRFWARVPLALPWVGMPGGAVGHIILQNKRITNNIQAAFNVSGAAAPYGMYSAVGAGVNNGAYDVTGNDTVTGTPSMDTWKILNTVPDSAAEMPVFGFTRYLQEVIQPYSGTSFTYNFEPGGVLLRALFHFFDATAAGGMATSNLSTITYQYGTNKQLDVFTPYRNILDQLELYGRTLPQGTYAFDYYTQKRNLTDAKSTENTANVQVVANFAAGYSVPANSQVVILLDKVFVAQNYLAA